MTIRNARPDEAQALTRLTLASKRYWGYSEEWMARWAEELAVSPAYIEKNTVILAEEDARPIGYVSILAYEPDHTVKAGPHRIAGGFFLDNCFVHPSHIGKGVGKALTAIALDWCRDRHIDRLYVYSDPNAIGFYQKMGASFLGEVRESGAVRPLPLLVFTLSP